MIPLLDPGSQSDAVGSTVHLQVAPADPVAGQALSFSATGLPSGLSISASGLITGKPTSARTFSPAVRASDGHGVSGTVSFSWAIRK